MLVTNQTTVDYWFGPLHLAAGVGQTLTVDDTTETSLYLLNDSVADALNNLYAAGKITVSSAASPFPRPTALSVARTDTFYPLGEAAAKAFRRADPPGTPSSFAVKYSGGDSAARLIRRARAINAELATVRQGAQVATLEGALSATGLALAIVDYSALYTTPYAGEYVGAGNPAEALQGAFSP